MSPRKTLMLAGLSCLLGAGAASAPSPAKPPAAVAPKAQPLELAWVRAPAVAEGKITGALRVVSHSRQPWTLTVILVAVNPSGKAFALAYAHERLPPGAATPPVRFAVAVPPGAYTVHADAAGVAPAPRPVRHLRLVWPGLVVPGAWPPDWVLHPAAPGPPAG